MASESFQQIKDSDYRNFVQDITDVVHLTTTEPTKATPDIYSDHMSKLENAKRKLRKDMHRLLNSPHVQRQAAPKLELSSEAVAALRSLYAIVQDVLKLAPEDVGSKEYAEMEAAVHRAVTAINPTHTFPEKKTGTAKDEGALKTSRKRQLALKLKNRREDEDDEDAELAELIGDDWEDDSEDEETDGEEEDAGGEDKEADGQGEDI
ncbi:Nn.00g008010.m01.CDS01 [Neocucurbitaria sp. VM-36]